MTDAERLAIELGAPVGDVDGRRLVPMLCGRDETGERILASEGFLFELKLDGVRIVADKRGDAVSLSYRRVRDATDSYGEIADAVRALAEERVVLDGEIVAFDDEGRPDFQRLGTRIQTRGRGARRARLEVPVVYVVFDVLVVGSRDVTGLPIEARKQILDRLLPGASGAAAHLRRHPTFPEGKELFRLCREHRLEGVVAKRAGSAYRVGERSDDWVKVKCELDADLVVIGFTEGEGKRARLGALDLGAYENGELVVRGSVGSGLDEDTIDALLPRLRRLESATPTATGKYLPKKGRHHVRPEIVVSVRYMGMTGDGLMRHPVFRGVRPDVRPEDCGSPGERARDVGAASRTKLTAPNAVVLPDGRTKRDLCRHYEAIAEHILPLVRGRIVMPLRYEPRAARKLAPLWPLPPWTPAWVRAVSAPRGATDVRGLVVTDIDTLLFAVEAGAASFALTSAREHAPRCADFAAIAVTGEAAAAARELARELGLEAFLTSTALAAAEVIVALGASTPWEGARAFAALFATLVPLWRPGSGVAEAIEAPLVPGAAAVGGAGEPFRVATADVPPREALRILNARVDFGAAVGRLERLVGREAPGKR